MYSIWNVVLSLLLLYCVQINARTCVCPMYYPYQIAVLPTLENSHVPQNTKIWIYHPLHTELVVKVKNSQGHFISGTNHQFTNNINYFEPQSNLELGETYKVYSEDLSSLLTSFTIETQVDLTPPSIPITTFPAIEISCCVGYQATYDVASEDLVVASLGTGHVHDVFSIYHSGDIVTAHNFFSSFLHIGNSGSACSDTNNWPEAGPGASTDIYFGSVDLAGNFSGWSDEQLLSFPQKEVSCNDDFITQYSPTNSWGCSLSSNKYQIQESYAQISNTIFFLIPLLIILIYKRFDK